MPSYLTQREAADLLRVSERQISRDRASGRLPFLKLGGNVRFRREHVEAMLSPATVQPTAPKSWTVTRQSADSAELPPGLLRPARRAI
jgi:putative molybdopterin biosynthesis protein